LPTEFLLLRIAAFPSGLSACGNGSDGAGGDLLCDGGRCPASVAEEAEDDNEGDGGVTRTSGTVATCDGSWFREDKASVVGRRKPESLLSSGRLAIDGGSAGLADIVS
jgi:hypothetical protein